MTKRAIVPGPSRWTRLYPGYLSWMPAIIKAEPPITDYRLAVLHRRSRHPWRSKVCWRVMRARNREFERLLARLDGDKPGWRTALLFR